MKQINEFNYSIERVIGFSCPSKKIISINGQIVCFVDGKKSCDAIIKYATTLDDSVLNNSKIKNKIKSILKID